FCRKNCYSGWMGSPPAVGQRCLSDGYQLRSFKKETSGNRQIEVRSPDSETTVRLFGNGDGFTRFELPMWSSWALAFRPTAEQLYQQALRVAGLPEEFREFNLQEEELHFLCEWNSNPEQSEKLSPQTFRQHLSEVPLANFKNKPTDAMQSYFRFAEKYLASQTGLTFDDYVAKEKEAADRLSKKLTLAKDTFLENGGSIAKGLYKIGTRLLGIDRDDYTIRLSYLGTITIEFRDRENIPLYKHKNEGGSMDILTADVFFEELDKYLKKTNRAFQKGMQYGEMRLTDLDRIVQVDREGMLNVLNYTEKKKLRFEYDQLLEYSVALIRRLI
ncbi:MAG: hypothetical protein Q7S68_03905, partial [Deltaproteobacteria bacterium]|nr:hypothetical protein [Deltaproteobacteria bacterium]